MPLTGECILGALTQSRDVAFQDPADFLGVSWSLLYLPTTSQYGNVHPRYQEVNSLFLPLPVCSDSTGLSDDRTNTVTYSHKWTFHNASAGLFSLLCPNDIHEKVL